jgi:hypothetical protein
MEHPRSSRGNGANFSIGQGFCDKRRERIGSRPGVVIQQPEILRAMSESVANSDVVAAREAQILPTFKQHYIGMSSPYSRSRIVSRPVVHNDHSHLQVGTLL